MNAAATTEPAPFAPSRALVEQLLHWLDGTEAAALSHGELESSVQDKGRELLRQFFQDHLDLRAQREPRVRVVDAAGRERTRVETGRHRALSTVFGEVDVTRRAYRQPGQANLYPADAALNLPPERHSHGLRRLAALEAARGSFDDSVAAIKRATGVQLGKRQTETLVAKAAADIDAFYAAITREPAAADDVVVLSCDGKGIVMRPDALRPATAKAAATTGKKLATRLSRGEKRNRKRLAELGTVYHLTPHPRSPGDIIASSDTSQPAPKAQHKWVTASVASAAAHVVARVFDEADRRDPEHQRSWVALVDGNNHQIDRINAEANTRGIDVAILIDIVHVIEYIWSAAWCFYNEGEHAAETWVRGRLLAVLNGNARDVAAGIRRRATTEGLLRSQRANADTCANYLTNKAEYLDYPTALANGWPIATGVIEGACRHLVKDRMDITGARWSVAGAEAILKLRALQTNGDFDTYWTWHLNQEQQRTHQARYANAVIPAAA